MRDAITRTTPKKLKLLEGLIYCSTSPPEACWSCWISTRST